MSTENQNTTEEVITYPTTPLPDADGFFYESAEDKQVDILTKEYENGNKVKKVLLPKCKKTALVRELKGKELKDVGRFMNKDVERYQMSIITVATLIDDKKETIEFFEEMKLTDLNLLISINNDLNF